MTYIGLLFILATFWATTWVFSSYRQYRLIAPLGHKDVVIKYKINIFIHAVAPYFFAFVFWLITIVIITFGFGDVPVYTYTKTIVNNENQIVTFVEQTDDTYIVSINDKPYVCDKVIISNELEHIRVIFNDCERANKFSYFFLYEIDVMPKDTYELHIPIGLLVSG